MKKKQPAMKGARPKGQHGGARPGAGRKPKPAGLHLLEGTRPRKQSRMEALIGKRNPRAETSLRFLDIDEILMTAGLAQPPRADLADLEGKLSPAQLALLGTFHRDERTKLFRPGGWENGKPGVFWGLVGPMGRHGQPVVVRGRVVGEPGWGWN